MPAVGTKKILDLPDNIRLWLEVELVKQDIPLRALAKELCKRVEKDTGAPYSINHGTLLNYRNFVIEARMKVREDTMEGADIFIEGSDVELLPAYKKIMWEAWKNYKKLEDEPKADTSRAKYFDVLIKSLDQVSKLEVSERDLLSAFDEVRQSSEKETSLEKFDHIVGFLVPRMIDKCENSQEAASLLRKLINHCIKLEAVLKEDMLIKDVIRLNLDWLYG